MKKFIVFVLIIFAVPCFAEITGVPILDQDYYELYDMELWGMEVDNICGPTTVTELMGYWAANGYPNLLDGELDGTVPETSQAITDLLYDMLWWTNWDINDGVPIMSKLSDGIEAYFNDRGYEVDVYLSPRGQVYWSQMTAEVDAGRLPILLRYDLKHYVVIIDYYDAPGIENDTYTVLYGHVPYVRVMSRVETSYTNLQVIYTRPLGEIPQPADPTIEPWYDDVMQWCSEHRWELEPID